MRFLCCPNPEHRVPGVCQECFQGIQEIPRGRSERGVWLKDGEVKLGKNVKNPGQSMENPCAFHIWTSSEHHLLDAWKCEIPFLIENFRWPKRTCWRTFANGPMTSVLETWEPAHRQLSESMAEWSCQRLPGPNRKRPERRKVFMLCFMAFSGCFMLFPLPCPVNEGWSNRKRRGATKRFWSPLVSKKSFKNRNSEVAVSSHKAGNSRTLSKDFV